MSIKTKKRKKGGYSSRLITVAAALSFLLLLINSDIAIEYMKKGLKLCANTVIPSLFPFMVISEIVVSSGLGRIVGKALSRPVKMLFGADEGSACAFILGIICGFPIGARCISSMVDRGEMNERSAAAAMTFCNNPGSAFIISAVGVSLFGSARLGVILYVCVILSAVIVGCVGRLFFKDCQAESSIPSQSEVDTQGASSAELFSSAIKSSATAMLTVCALVTFFSAIVGCVGAIMDKVGVGRELTAVIFCFFEISSGVSSAAESCSGPFAAILLTAAALGWSGLSVHFQVMSVCAGRNISFKPYFLAKAAQGIISAALTAVTLELFPFSEEVFKEVVAHTPVSIVSRADLVCVLFFFASILPIFLIIIRQKQCKKSKRKNF